AFGRSANDGPRIGSEDARAKTVSPSSPLHWPEREFNGPVLDAEQLTISGLRQGRHQLASAILSAFLTGSSPVSNLGMAASRTPLRVRDCAWLPKIRSKTGLQNESNAALQAFDGKTVAIERIPSLLTFA